MDLTLSGGLLTPKSGGGAASLASMAAAVRHTGMAAGRRGPLAVASSGSHKRMKKMQGLRQIIGLMSNLGATFPALAAAPVGPAGTQFAAKDMAGVNIANARAGEASRRQERAPGQMGGDRFVLRQAPAPPMQQQQRPRAEDKQGGVAQAQLAEEKLVDI